MQKHNRNSSLLLIILENCSISMLGMKYCYRERFSEVKQVIVIKLKRKFKSAKLWRILSTFISKKKEN